MPDVPIDLIIVHLFVSRQAWLVLIFWWGEGRGRETELWATRVPSTPLRFGRDDGMGERSGRDDGVAAGSIMLGSK